MRWPSPALVLAAIAVAGAWVGPAVAAKLIGSRDVRNNSLTTADIRDRTLTSRDIKSNSLTGRVVANLSGRDIIDDGLDGSDIDERTLEAVGSARRADAADRAAHADTATTAENLNGVRVQRIAYARPVSAEATTALDLGGLRLTARCTGAGVLAVSAATTTVGFVRTTTAGAGNAAAAYAEDDDFRPGDAFDLLPGADDDVSGTLSYYAGDGGVVTVTYMAESAVAASRGFACLFAGTATYAAAG